MNTPLRIWCNMRFPEPAVEQLRQGTAAHTLLFPPNPQASNLIATPAPDPQFDTADIIFGQPDPAAALNQPRLKWVHLSSAGYERYDTPDFRAAAKARGLMLSNSSGVYEEPCAEHVMAMMLAGARRMPESLDNQRSARGWPSLAIRSRCSLLMGQTALLVGLGTIGNRLAELLAPYHMNLMAVRRSPRGDEPVKTFAVTELERLLPQADHVIVILPGGAGTAGLFARRHFAQMKPSALFYNIGRGTTVDQIALLEALQSNQIAGAFLDVMTPEPLPPEHALWSLPNCWITPHTAGGHHDEHLRLVNHFLSNLERFVAARELSNRVI